MVRSYSKIILISGALVAVTACQRAPLPPPEYHYERDAIQVYLEAGPQLNLYRGTPHTLLLCVYQLENPNSFDQLKQDGKGLQKLLECGRFDGSITSAKRLVLQPGQRERIALARAEGTKYVGVVAGYYLLEGKNVVRLFKIPVIEEKKGIIRVKRTLKLGTLHIDLYLGSHSIQKMERK